MHEAQYVTPEDSQNLLTLLNQVPGTSREGFFGRTSLTWRVNREAGVFLGAGRAALLQLAHPWVATSLAQHSNLLHDPIGRFHSTFRVVYTMLFGTREQALSAARRLFHRHTSISGELFDRVGAHAPGEHYEANETGALLWVFATLVDSAILGYQAVLPPLAPAEISQYYSESKRMASLFGIAPQSLPADWSAFSRYMAEMTSSPELGVNASARALGLSVLSGVGSAVRPPSWYKALTASWMPDRLRDEFGLVFHAQQEQSAARALEWLPRLYPALPKVLRFVGPYHEAQARLQGNSPGILTRGSNQFWMGQSLLLFPEQH